MARPPFNVVPVNLAYRANAHTHNTRKQANTEADAESGMKSPSPPRLAERSTSGQREAPLGTARPCSPPAPTPLPPLTSGHWRRFV